MPRADPLRILVVDDVGLIATCVAARLRSAANQSALADCRLGAVEAVTIQGGGKGKQAAARIQATIFEHDINVLVVDRGIADAMEEDSGQLSNAATMKYYRSQNAKYDYIERILAALSPAARKKIDVILIYTLDELEKGKTWYIDEDEVRDLLKKTFDHSPHIGVIKTNSEIYFGTGLKRFNPVPGDRDQREVAHGPDLQLYGAIVGEMAWRHISASVLRCQAAHRLGLRRWLIRNYFIFALITFGLGIGISAGYDLIRASVLPGALVLVCAVLGLLVPFLLLHSNPKLLMLPNIDDDQD